MHQNSQTAFKDRVRAKTGRSRGDSHRRIVEDLNPASRGWFGYFQHAGPFLFKMLDGFIRRRLRAILRTQDRCPSMGRSAADRRRWSNAIFVSQGWWFALYAAYGTTRHPR